MLATANALASAGYAVTVLACDIDDLARYSGCDMGLLDLVDPQVEVVRVPFELGIVEPDLHRYSRLRAIMPRVWKRLHNARVRRAFPETVYGLWQKPLENAARGVHQRRAVDLTIASGGPFVSFTAGHYLRDRYGVPYVLDYRDSWSLQQFTDDRIHAPGSRVETAESALLDGAHRVWFVNEAMREWHELTYPQIVRKTRVVLNGYDPEHLTGVPAPRLPEGASVRFGYLGTLTTAVPLRECLDGFRRAAEIDPAMSGSTLEFHGYLGFYPTPNATLRSLIEGASDIGVTYTGPVPKAEVATVYANVDALVLTFGGSKYVTSGKVFEYMATGRPVVSVHAPENAARDVLEGYPLWFQAASLTPDDVARVFIQAGEAVRSGKASDPAVYRACVDHARQFERGRSLAEAITDLSTLRGPGG